MDFHDEIFKIIIAFIFSHEGAWNSMNAAWKQNYQAQPSIGPVVSSHEISWNTKRCDSMAL